LRTSNSAHPQMRELTIPLLREMQRKIPLVFDE
jgi:thymidylate synthase ThyX